MWLCAYVCVGMCWSVAVSTYVRVCMYVRSVSVHACVVHVEGRFIWCMSMVHMVCVVCMQECICS